MPWDGNGDRAAVAVVANTYYRAGSGDQLVVKGDPRIISHVYVRDGVVGIDCRTGGFFHNNAERIEVTLPGRNFRAFEQLGSGNMRLAGLSQPEARISVEGSGNIEADGKIGRLKAVIEGSGTLAASGAADNLDLNLEGSGDAKLGELVVKNANVTIEGSGDVEIAPQSASRVDITGEGSGDIKARGTTDALKVDVRGSGDVRLGGLTAKNRRCRYRRQRRGRDRAPGCLDCRHWRLRRCHLRSEPKKLDASFAGSGHITHPDGTRQDRHSKERHARLEKDDFGAIADDAVARGGPPDPDELDRAKAKLKARIRHQVAQALAGEDQP